MTSANLGLTDRGAQGGKTETLRLKKINKKNTDEAKTVIEW